MALTLEALEAADPAADAALLRSLRASSSALVRLQPAHARELRELDRLARRFFALPGAAKQRARATLCLPCVGTVEVCQGFHVPSAAKELLRLFAAARVAPLGLPTRLRRAAGRAAASLDRLLAACLGSVLRGVGRAVSARTMRRLIGANRVLDCFHYHNRTPSLPNCTPHVDRGLLHAIVASPVDGLELRGADGGWRAPHELWPAIEPHRDVLVLCNHALQELSRGWPAGRQLEACTHRVVRPAAGAVARLSVSYEVRPAADAEPEVWEPLK
jgi:isopenicillin N synthase-like dioxygenase